MAVFEWSGREGSSHSNSLTKGEMSRHCDQTKGCFHSRALRLRKVTMVNVSRRSSKRIDMEMHSKHWVDSCVRTSLFGARPLYLFHKSLNCDRHWGTLAKGKRKFKTWNKSTIYLAWSRICVSPSCQSDPPSPRWKNMKEFWDKQVCIPR